MFPRENPFRDSDLEKILHLHEAKSPHDSAGTNVERVARPICGKSCFLKRAHDTVRHA